MNSNFFKDKHGHWTLWQWPNLSLGLWITAVILQRFFTGRTHDLLGLVALVSLAYWAGLEIFYGDSRFRRLLGFIVLLMMIKNRLR